MNRNDFTINSPGKLVAIPEGVEAFVPQKLPPTLSLNDSDLLSLLSEANLALGELKGIGRNLQNPYLLIGPLSLREAIVSSKLEGTIASAEEVAILNARPDKKPPRNETREVQNYVEALNHGLERLSEIPVSKRLIREIHGKLLQGVRGQDNSPGEFRRQQNAIGWKGQPLQEARYVPPPPPQLEHCLDDFEDYLNIDRPYPPLIDLALIHYQFEAIHPFMDGNGRIGRLLIVLLLCHWQFLGKPLLYMSGFFERNRNDYKDLLLAVSQTGSWIDWVRFFLRGVVEQCGDAVNRSDRLLSLQSDYRQKFQLAGSSALSLKLIDSLFERPFMTMYRAATILSVTNATAQNHIGKLVDADILYEATGDKRNRVYLAKDILQIINEE